MIDLSHPIITGMPVYPGDPEVELIAVDSGELRTPGEHHVNLGQMKLGLHAGTHMDAPFHFLKYGMSIDRVPLAHCTGPACSIRVDGGNVDRAHLIECEAMIRETRRVIINTGWFRHWGEDNYFTAHPVLTKDAAEFLRECGVVLLGIDTPSVDHAPFETHVVLLGAGIVIVENLTNLDLLPPTPFQFAALPLAIRGRDASPVRAVAWT